MKIKMIVVLSFLATAPAMAQEDTTQVDAGSTAGSNLPDTLGNDTTLPVPNLQDLAEADSMTAAKERKLAQGDSVFEYLNKNRGNFMKAIIVDGDTIPIMTLNEVLLVDKPTFDSRNAKRRYYILRRKVIKVYPYAIIAGNKLDSLNLMLAQEKRKRKRKKLVKAFQNYMKDKFEEDLKKLTHSEGQILSKLIHRETGETTYNLIKDYRNGFLAVWWNTIAFFNKIDLKTPYQPKTDEEDKLIETILQAAFRNNLLEEREPITSLEQLEEKD